MKLTIFGVGRSGTKAVQLYLSYLIAQRENNVWINYEPYFWMNRHTQNINYEGYFHHSRAPHLIKSAKDLSKEHLHFIKKLSVSGISSTTKFIRANGRMEAINQVLEPDHSFVIVRDLYQVLVSVLKTEWDFWSIGFEYPQNWEGFVQEVRQKKLIDNFDWCMEQINDRIDQNAFYWYAMNKAVLQSTWPGTYFIPYSQITAVEEIARTIIDSRSDESIREELFTGSYIHENYPLLSKTNIGNFKDITNSLFYHAKLMNKYGWCIPSKSYGASANVNTDYKKIQPTRQSGTKVSIERKDLFEFINEDISQMLHKIEWKNQDQVQLESI